MSKQFYAMDIGHAFSGQVVPFPSTATIFASYLVVFVVCLGAIFSSIIIISVARHQISPRMTIVISLCCADLFLFIMTAILLSANLKQGGWATGAAGCVVSSVYTMNAVGASMIHAFVMTLERYTAILYGKTMTKKVAVRTVIAIWSIILLLALMPVLTGTYRESVVLSPSFLNCTPNWTSSSFLSRGCALISFATLFVTAIFSIFAYTRIILSYKALLMAKKIKEKKKERTLLLKAITISLSFTVLWIPYGILILSNIITRSVASESFDIAAVILGVLNAFFNPIIFYTLDNGIRSSCNRTLSVLTMTSSTLYSKAEFGSEPTIKSNGLDSLRDAPTMMPVEG